jgi:acetyl-CoA carboxylase carboxyl transferase subunit beta
MMGFLRLFTKQKPKIKVESTKKDGFSGWIKCSQCAEMVHSKEMQENYNCCAKCGYHYRFSADQRIDLLADEDSFTEFFTELQPMDPLDFVDSETYKERLTRAQEKTRRTEGVYVGSCTVEGKKIALAVMDFNFMGGSMGSVVGEKITRLIEYAIDQAIPVVIVSSSGGARMQESSLSLMQMAKTSAALGKLRECSLPYISILTNPTLGGVTASFASLGDIIMAEPDALIGFAGPRVVEQTIRHKLPPTAQKSEFLLDKGMIDCVVPRAELKKKLYFFLEFLYPSPVSSAPSSEEMKQEEYPTLNKLDQLIKIAKEKQSKTTAKR